MMNGGWLGGLLMLLFGALVVAGIVVLIVWAVRQSSGHTAAGGSAPPSGVAGHDEAIAIAKRRLASGEITKEQYGDIVKVLG
jgi:uncharacterized membrane protein